MLNPETLTVLDPACGSGHILVEAYDLLKAIYLERGYPLRSIPRLILEKNLYGLDIDDRAAQLAGFALLMKARADDRRLLDNPPQLNVLAIQASNNLNVPLLWQQLDLNRQSQLGTTSSLFADPQTDLTQAIDNSQYQLIENTLALFEQAQTLGSLIQVPAGHLEPLQAILAQCQTLASQGDNFQKTAATTLLPFIRQAVILAMQFDAVVANPPYMGNKYLTPSLKFYLKEHYKGFEKDLFSAFMIRDLLLTKESGLLGFMSPFVWMFISSYEELRTHFIDNATLTSLIQLEYSGFDGATVPICTFTLAKTHISNYTGSYIKLSDFKGHENQAPRTIEAIQNEDCGWFYQAKSDDFKKIPGSPVAYWVSKSLIRVFTDKACLSDIGKLGKGSDTGNNDLFIRHWAEVPINKIGFGIFNNGESIQSKKKFFPTHKAGGFRKWYGLREWIVNWEKNGCDVHNYGKGNIRNASYYFCPCVTWGKVSSATFSARYIQQGSIADDASPSMYAPDSEKSILALLNSNLATKLLQILSPTLNFQVGDIAKLPAPKLWDDQIVSSLIQHSIDDYNSYETSWDFTDNPLIRQKQNFVGWVSDSVTQQIEATDVGLRDKAANPTYTLTPIIQNEQEGLTVRPYILILHS